MRFLSAALLALCVVACGPAAPTFRGSDVTGIGYGRDFHLYDHHGQPRTLADFRGKVVALFFGYTQCPDVCPTTLSELATALQRLGPDAARVQVLFVTIDPQRDTPELLSRYVPAFNPTFLGLYGDAAATAAVAKEFRIVYEKEPGPTEGSYTHGPFGRHLPFRCAGPASRLRKLRPGSRRLRARHRRAAQVLASRLGR